MTNAISIHRQPTILVPAANFLNMINRPVETLSIHHDITCKFENCIFPSCLGAIPFKAFIQLEPETTTPQASFQSRPGKPVPFLFRGDRCPLSISHRCPPAGLFVAIRVAKPSPQQDKEATAHFFRPRRQVRQPPNRLAHTRTHVLPPNGEPALCPSARLAGFHRRHQHNINICLRFRGPGRQKARWLLSRVGPSVPSRHAVSEPGHPRF